MAKKAAKPASKKKSGGTDDFDKLVNSPEYKKAYEEKKHVEPGESLGNPTLPDGAYPSKVTAAKVGVTKDKSEKGGKPAFPYIVIDTAIDEGEEAGTKVGHFFSLHPDKMEYAIKAVKRLGYQLEDATLADFKGIAADLNSEKPRVEIAAQNKEVEVIDPQNKKKKIKKEVCNWFINKLL